MKNHTQRVSARNVRRSMAIASALIVVAAASVLPLQAQVVQGHVRDAVSGAPTAMVLVLILDTAGVQHSGMLTDAAGRFRLRAPAPGRYRIQATRIGYHEASSETVWLESGQAVDLTLDLQPAAIELEGLRVEGRRRCSIGTDEGALVMGLWEQARSALLNQAWTERTGVARFRVVEYRRLTDLETGLATTEDRRMTSWVGRNPIRSLPAADLLTRGFVRSDGQGGFEYYAPDASVLLSDEFLEAHCLGITTSTRQPDRVGVTFQPVSVRRGIAGIEGTIWLDRIDARLRTLDFTYTWSPWAEAIGVAAGHVEFEELPDGAWIVRRWRIRMPRMTRNLGLMERGGSGLRVAGLVEVGGAATQVQQPKADAAAGSMRATIRGTVWDSTRARPLVGAEVYVLEEGPRAVTDPSGAFTLTDVPVGLAELTFRHPRLDSLPVAAPVSEALAVTDSASSVHLAIPTSATILTALCGSVGAPPGSGAVFGMVRSLGGRNSVPGAEVRIEWTNYRAPGGRDILADVETLSVTADEHGRYVACGVPPGVALAARAAQTDAEGPMRRADVPTDGLLALELLAEGGPDQAVAPQQGTCIQEGPGGTHGAVVGHLREGTTGVPVGHTAIWLVPIDEDAPTLSVTADATGRFAFCDVAPGSYLVRASLVGLGEARVDVLVGAGTEATAELHLRRLASAGGSGTIRGRVTRADDGRPLVGAEVQIRDGGVRLTDGDGRFVFRDVAPGSTSISAAFLGYAPSEGTVVVGGGQEVSLEVRLSSQAIELEPIVVEAVRFSSGGMLADVRRRAGSAFGVVLIGESLERRLPTITRTTDLLREHGATVLSNGSSFYFHRTGCAPHVYIDGVRVTRVPRSGGGLAPQLRGREDPPEIEAARALNMIDPASISAMEIYRGPGETPGEFLDSDARCGVVLVWTRRGEGVGSR